MKHQLEKDLGRTLTPQEARHIEWLLGCEKETVETFNGLFSDLFKAGQESASKGVS